MSKFALIDGGITAPKGFKAAGIHVGIKKSAPDLALIVSEQPAAVAGTFTTNRIQAAPVKLCRDRLAGKRAQAIVVSSGNANACTGPQGMIDAVRMGHVAAERLGLDEERVFVCSTGKIGVPLPMDKIEAGIKTAVGILSDSGGEAAAKAILTTDTVDKQITLEMKIDSVPVRLGGMVKGAGMIDPKMATMLAFLTTDADVESEALQDCLSSAVEQSFNKITVDGDRSTNDTVLFMANGAAGNSPLDTRHADWNIFTAAVDEVTKQLALKIVKDGEGATTLVTVVVSGAASLDDATMAARAVANSLLVKTSWTGDDPNWGRIMDAVGYSGADVKEDLIDIRYDDVMAVRKGRAAEGISMKDVKDVVSKKCFTVHIDLNLGDETDAVYACDCSEEYVRINSS